MADFCPFCKKEHHYVRLELTESICKARINRINVIDMHPVFSCLCCKIQWKKGTLLWTLFVNYQGNHSKKT